ncbi:MAG: MFS transporter [Firmicutes bacterium]|nr:MFS transporter [Bacillota bacterium]
MVGKIKANYSHYSWVMLITGVLAVFGALGLARYGYSMLLPSMQVDLNLDNSHAGLLATANLAGYLAFAIIGGALSAYFGIRLVAAIGLLLAGIGMICTGFTNTFLSAAIWRGMTGLGSGAANIAIMGLWAAWFSKRKRGFASGIAVSGSSVGLIFTGLFVPWIISNYGDDAWHIAWFIFGGITVILAIGVYLIIRNNPSDMELSYVQKNGDHQPATQTSGSSCLWKQVYLSARVWCFGLIYSAFGFSYIIYMTFFVKSLASDYGYTVGESGKLFMTMGWFSLLCGIIWGAVSDRIGRKNTLIVLFLIHTVAFALFGIGNSHIYFLVSAILFGLSAWSIPAIMSAACGDMLGAKLAPAALGFITLFFGIGQALGPVVGGAISEITGSFSHSFFLASAVALLGAIGTMFFPAEIRGDNNWRYTSSSI